MTRLLEAADLLRIAVPNDPRLSPDGRLVAYTLTLPDAELDGYRSAIWVADTDGSGEPRQWTSGQRRDIAPRWSRDGRTLAFISDRDGRPAIWQLDVGEGEAQRVGEIPGDVLEIDWAPDGRRLVATVYEPAPASTTDVRLITRLRHKADGTGFTYDRRKHLWIVDRATGASRRLTDGEWDESAPVWSPDGRWIAFLSNRTEQPDLNNVMDVWIVPTDNDDEPCNLTRSHGPCMAPAWSPDSRWIAYSGNTDPPETGVSTNHHLWLAGLDRAPPHDVIEHADICLGTLVLTDLHRGSPASPILWSADCQSVDVLVTERGSTRLDRVDLATGKMTRVVAGDRHLYAAHAAGDCVAFVAADFLTPGDVFVQSNGQERRLTNVNAELLGELDLSCPERLEAISADGTPVDGWALRPPSLGADQRAPAVLEIHGGPYYVLFGHTFFHQIHLLAARGYVVLFVNPRGSQGYGQAFASANRADWGGVDYADLMAAVDWLVQQPYVDRDRLGVSGGSFGGFMTNWIVTQTDRFSAAVSQRGISNHASAYGTSDVAYGPLDWIFKGPPWEQPELYRERSPITHVERVRTPLLLIHNERDLRCAIEQSEQFFTALKRLGREVALVRIPDEDHNLSRNGRPSHRLERLRWIVRWFDENLQCV